LSRPNIQRFFISVVLIKYMPDPIPSMKYGYILFLGVVMILTWKITVPSAEAKAAAQAAQLLRNFGSILLPLEATKEFLGQEPSNVQKVIIDSIHYVIIPALAGKGSYFLTQKACEKLQVMFPNLEIPSTEISVVVGIGVSGALGYWGGKYFCYLFGGPWGNGICRVIITFAGPVYFLETNKEEFAKAIQLAAKNNELKVAEAMNQQKILNQQETIERQEKELREERTRTKEMNRQLEEMKRAKEIKSQL